MLDQVYGESELAYQSVQERSALATTFRQIIMDIQTPAGTIDKLIKFIHNEAEAIKRHDVLESLYFAGLIYG